MRLTRNYGYYLERFNSHERAITREYGSYDDLEYLFDKSCTYNYDSRHLFYVEMSCGTDKKYEKDVIDSSELLAKVRGQF